MVIYSHEVNHLIVAGDKFYLVGVIGPILSHFSRNWKKVCAMRIEYLIHLAFWHACNYIEGV